MTDRDATLWHGHKKNKEPTMELKEKMNSYQPQPDAEVWNRINNTMKRRRMARWGAAIGGTAVVAASALLFLTPKAEPAIAEQPAETPVAVAMNEPTTNEVNEETTIQTPVKQVEKREEATPVAAAPTVRANSSNTSSQMVALPTSVTPAPKVSTPVVQAQKEVAQARAEAPAQAPAANQEATVQQQQPKAQIKTPVSSKITPNTPADELAVWIPNAFAPDDPSGNVRTFHIIPNNGSSISQFKLYIYNRGGRQVFYTTDVNFQWDGTAKGQAQPAGAYVYKMEYKDAVKGLQHVTGSVLLVR